MSAGADPLRRDPEAEDLAEANVRALVEGCPYPLGSARRTHYFRQLVLAIGRAYVATTPPAGRRAPLAAPRPGVTHAAITHPRDE